MVDDVFRLVSIQGPNAAFGVESRLAHIGTVHGAGTASTAAAPNGEDGVIARHDHGHCPTNLCDLAEHFMAEHEVVVRGWCLGAAARCLLAVSAADSNAQHAEFDLVRRSNRWFQPIDNADAPRSRNNGNRSHAVPCSGVSATTA